MKFKALAETFKELEGTESSLEMIDILANFFSEISPEEAQMAAYLIRGRVGPLYEDVEFQVAEKLLIQAIAEAADDKEENIRQKYNERGDLGLVVEEVRKSKKGETFSISEVFEKLKDVAIAEGSGSQGEKIQKLSELIQNSSAIEARYICRLVPGKLRLGVAEMTFLNGLSKGLTGETKKKSVLEHAFNVYSDLGRVAYEAIKYGVDSMSDVEPTVGVPIRMMLAQRVKTVEEARENVTNDLWVEYKYDGERAQIHIEKDGTVKMYSRRHEDITYQFPDIVDALKRSFSGKSVIIEGEIVAVNKESGKLEDFQKLMSRRRKYEIEKYIEKVPVNLFVFEILLAEDKSLMKQPLHERKDKIREFFSENDIIKFSNEMVTKEPAEAEEFFFKSLEGGAEGVMIKDKESIYQAGSRGWRWIKYKKDYQQGLTDTFDVVVVGAVHGTGRRGGTYGSLLVASFDPDSNKYLSFTKVGAGFTDENLKELPSKLDGYKTEEKHRLVETDAEVDVWFEPRVVMEIMGAELTASPIHKVAKDRMKKEKGLALRFPRFLRWRSDKGPEQATTPAEIHQIYRQQQT